MPTQQIGRPDDDRRCTAKSKQTGERCGQWAARGKKVCRFHGANGGAKKGNKNAVKTGEFEKIFFDTLTDDELAIAESFPKDDIIKLIDAELVLITVRERRMLYLAEQVRDGWESDDLEVHHERRKTKPNGETYEMTEVARVERQRPQLERLLAIEEALSRVQDKKAKLMDLKHRVKMSEKDGKQGQGLLAELASVIKESTELLTVQKATST